MIYCEYKKLKSLSTILLKIIEFDFWFAAQLLTISVTTTSKDTKFDSSMDTLFLH